MCLLVRTLHLFSYYCCAQVLKLLERNVEANRHLFTAERPLPKSDAIGATAAGTSRENGESGSHGGPGHCVAAVRELDWFTFSREKGTTDAAICDYPAGEGGQVRELAVGHSKEHHLAIIFLFFCPLLLLVSSHEPDLSDQSSQTYSGFSPS